MLSPLSKSKSYRFQHKHLLGIEGLSRDDVYAILDLANQNNGMVLTLEDNYGGGFGSAVADAVAADGGGFNVRQMHVRRIPKSGREPDEVMAYCGLSAGDIVREAMALLELTPA